MTCPIDHKVTKPPRIHGYEVTIMRDMQVFDALLVFASIITVGTIGQVMTVGPH